MAEFKQHRDNDHKLHEQLYENLYLLSQFYPTSKDFNLVFKKDMFVKNNKAAFFEVVYYLLNTLNPELTKQKLTAWPPYDIKRETKFRMEVLKYINELNTFYDNADIPNIMSSHFISPGGLKFTKFMLKLSQLVVYEHLKKTEELDLLYCPKPSKNNTINKAVLRNIKKKTDLIEQETNNLINDFERFHLNSKQEALSIVNRLKEINDSIRTAKKENCSAKEEFNKKHPNYPSPSELEERICSVKCQFEGLQEIHDIFKECESLISYLNSNELVLEHSKDQKLPNEVCHIVKNREELNLISFFQALNILIERKALEFPYPVESYVNANSEKVKELTLKYSEVHKTLLVNLKETEDTLEKISQQIKRLYEMDRTSEAEEVLAIPLSD